MPDTNIIPPLQPGDILLYDSGSLVDWLIKFRTWSDVAHVEIYLDNYESTASRNGLGVDIYPVRYEGLRYIRRLQVPFDRIAARKFAIKMRGTPYGYGDLARFYLLNIPTKGLICSQYGDLLLRAGSVVAFYEDYPPGAVSPRDYELIPNFIAKTVWQAG